MQVGILGPLEVIGPDGPVTVAGGRLRHLLVRLAADAGRAVPVRELIDAVWPDDPPADATNALQALVSRLRRTLGDPGLVRQSVGGYRLAIAVDDLDAHRFRTLAAQGRDTLGTGSREDARATLADALALWRGAALADAEDTGYAGWAGPVAASLEELRLGTIALRIEADLVAGAVSGLVAELEALCQAHPLREDLTGLHLRALAAAGRPAEALTAYERMRSTLAETLGTDPSPALRQTHLDLLRAETPAPTPSRRRTTLRSGLTTFLGRETEQARILTLLDTSRLTTVVGPGGAGKTRIASQVGAAWAERADHAPDGVWLVELAPVTDPESVVQAFLGALDLRETHLLDRSRDRLPVREDLALLVGFLAGSRSLLVVDNCEHLIEATAQLIDTLLASSSELRVLATSREPLGIDGEALCILPPLTMPPADADASEASRYAAVQLFVDRASSVRSEVRLDAGSVADIVEIVRRLDGLPLAIELAAARTRILPVAEVRSRLTDRFRLLTGGSRTAMPRHRTLRAVVEWSWELLSPPERLLAERLAVFPAGATPRSAAAVCSAQHLEAPHLAADDVTQLLDALVDKSLLSVRSEPREGGVRYRMLETIREFGIERLAQRGEVVQARRRHAIWFAGLVAELAPLLRGAAQLDAVATLEAERDNVLGALRYLVDSGDGQGALAMALELSWYWSLLGNHAEATMWLESALATPGELDPANRTLGRITLLLNQVISAESAVDHLSMIGAMHEASLELEQLAGGDGLPPHIHMLRAGMAMFSGDEELAGKVVLDGLADPDPWVRASMRMLRATIAENAGDIDRMRADIDVADTEFEALGDRWGAASVLSVRAQLQTLDGDIEGAIASFDRAARHMAELGAHSDEALMAMRRSGLRIRLGDFDGAERDVDALTLEELGGFGEALAGAMRGMVAVGRGDREVIDAFRPHLRECLDASNGAIPMRDHARAMVLSVMALLDLAVDDVDHAASVLIEAHEVTLATHDMPMVATYAIVLAALQQARGEPEASARLLGAATRLRGADDPTDIVVRRLRSELPAALGADVFTAAYERGRGLSREAALALVEPPTP